jgi:transposase-like protein
MRNDAPKRKRTQKGQAILNINEEQAREHVERLLWPDGKPVCRHCGSVNAYRMSGKSIRPGLCRCRDCEKQFTVTVGTIFEDSHLPLSTWIKAFHLMCSSKKGISALQLQRNLGLGSYKTAWHLAHRIRLAMKCEPMAGELKGIVEVDEVYLGAKSKMPGRSGDKKQIVVALIERDGKAITPAVSNVGGRELKRVIRAHVDQSAVIHTDGFGSYQGLDKDFAGHETVNHAQGEYARGNVHVNTCESFFGLMRRGVIGSFHHISAKHAHRYADEFCFRWNGRKISDAERRTLAIQQVEGKRLMYKMPMADKTK